MGKTRKQNVKSFRQAVLVICPGDTEAGYLVSLKGDRYRLLTVEIKKQSGQADKYEKVFRDLRKDYCQNEPLQPCFVIIDMDTINNQKKLNHYLQDRSRTIKASKGTLKVIESMPCIEFWFLLHFCYSDRLYLNCGSVSHELERYILGYVKTYDSACEFYNQQKGKIEVAMDNAARTMKKKERCEGDCSYTNMHELIVELDEIYKTR